MTIHIITPSAIVMGEGRELGAGLYTVSVTLNMLSRDFSMELAGALQTFVLEFVPSP